ncbi:GftB: Glycosyl transferase, family 8 [Streptococcus sp. DD10]|uniref:accessory Sec system glycosylation chaperone GtfB n=1 Tax=Streptococcus sp. DD10 TaxID=1777878 RepID=UPI000794274A|nr:accessory Sec system glycosylation chaperone GtfB [Streptococcus sp. DD10]KXT77134.1 GftB: Glycosyl transferase, family 8 [Streptococcus sp. DD10]
MINLFDNYSQTTQDLHHSLNAAGYNHPSIVLEPNGFLPEDVISPFTYYLDNKKEKARGRYFNEVQVPAYWEILGNNQSARVMSYEKERAKISFHQASNKRVVEKVEWLDENGQVRLADHYDKYGNHYAQTTFSSENQQLITSYFTTNGVERIVENHVTGDVILTLENQGMKIFKSRSDFFRYFLQENGFNLDHIFFNTLAQSFLLSFTLPADGGSDILIWQEPIQDTIPGNMNLILENDHLRAKRIVVPNEETYLRLKELVPKEQAHKLVQLGYIYDFVSPSVLSQEVFVLTNSDQIEQIDYLAENLPGVKLHIAALTEMSPKLMSLVRHKNTILYQNINQTRISKLLEQMPIYLDINHYGEVNGIVRRAFDNHLAIYAFENTSHNRFYTAKEHIFAVDQGAQLLEAIKDTLSGKQKLNSALRLQEKQANSITEKKFKTELDKLLGGL